MINSKLPDCDYALVIRTDFSDDAAWEELCRVIQQPRFEYETRQPLECIDDESCSGLAPAAVASVLPAGSYRPFVFLADAQTISQAEHALLAVDLQEAPGRTMRVIPAEAGSVAANLILANMEFSEFAISVDPDGVYRGFPEAPA